MICASNNLEIGRVNPLNAELNPICHLLALLGAHHILHVSGLWVSIDVLLTVHLSVILVIN